MIVVKRCAGRQHGENIMLENAGLMDALRKVHFMSNIRDKMTRIACIS